MLLVATVLSPNHSVVAVLAGPASTWRVSNLRNMATRVASLWTRQQTPFHLTNDGATMSAFPNTREALGESWSKTGRHAKRIARHGRHAAEDIAGELRDLLAELEATLGEGTQADAAVLREDVRKRLDAARARLDETRSAARDRAGAAFSNADDYVHDNPWRAIAIIGGAALIVGALVGRCGGSSD